MHLAVRDEASAAERCRHVVRAVTSGGPQSRRQRRSRRVWLAVVEALEARRLLTTFVVTDTSDSASDTGSLRYAVNTAVGGDTITFSQTAFPAGQLTTITLNDLARIVQVVS
jgi:hypothetical protein